MKVNDLRNLLDTDGIVKVQSDHDSCPSWILLSTPTSRLGLFGTTMTNDMTGVEIRNIPNMTSMIENIIEDKMEHIYLRPNDSQTWKEYEEIMRLEIMNVLSPLPNDHDAFGVHIEPTPQQIDQNTLTGYITFLYQEFRMVYYFKIMPNELLKRPKISVQEFVNQFPKELNG